MRSLEIHAVRDLRLVEREIAEPGPGQVRIAVEYGGICGSDLGYWKHGGTGTARMTHPFVLGHEISGHVDALGEGVEGLAVGQGVTVHPARTTGPLPERLAGRDNLHPQLTYFGSAQHEPHTDGAFADSVVVDADQVVPLPEELPTRRAVLAEPLGVAMHAVSRAGDVTGRHVLVSGCGPVGLLVVLAARAAGARRITAVDLSEVARERALALGADVAADSPDDLDEEFTVAFEAAGVAPSLEGILRNAARASVVVQVGNLPTTPVQVTLATLVTREIDYRGTFRFVDEIERAVELLATTPEAEQVISDEFPLDQAEAAFEAAAGRGSIKVVLTIA